MHNYSYSNDRRLYYNEVDFSKFNKISYIVVIILFLNMNS